MAPIINKNKQPVFAASPILKTFVGDVEVINDNYQTYGGNWSKPPTTIYTASTVNGIIIDRITITSAGDLTNNLISAKLVYIYLGLSSNKYSLYKTITIPETTISSTTPNPEVELVFAGGLILNNGDSILVGASENASNSGRNGDYLSITVEGGNYDI